MAVRFNAANDRYITTAGLPLGGVYTVTCWAYLSADRNDYSEVFTLHGFAGSNALPDLGVGTDASGTAAGIYVTGGSEIKPAYNFPVNSPSSGWTRIALVVDNPTVTFWIGSATGGLITASGNGTPPNPPKRLFVGSDLYNEYFNGRVAAFKMWSAALTLNEVTAELAQYQPVRTANLLRYHPFVTAPGTTDESGNGNNLTGGTDSTTTEAGPDIPEGGSTAPAVNAGADASVASGVAFTRTATEDDGGAEITSRAWTIQSGPSGVGSTIGTTAALTWTPVSTGTYVLRYSATNSVGTGTDDVTVTVTAAPVYVSAARSGSGATGPVLGQVGTATALEGRATGRSTAAYVGQAVPLTTAPARAGSRAGVPILASTTALAVSSARASTHGERPLVAQYVGALVVGNVHAGTRATPVGPPAQTHPVAAADERADTAAERPSVSQATVAVVHGIRTVSTASTAAVGQRQDLPVHGLRTGTTASLVILSGIRPARAAARAGRPALTQHTAIGPPFPARATAIAPTVSIAQAHPPLVVPAPGPLATTATTPAAAQHSTVTALDARTPSRADAALVEQHTALATRGSRSGSRATVTVPVDQTAGLIVGDGRSATAAASPAAAQTSTLDAAPTRAVARSTASVVTQVVSLTVGGARSVGRARRVARLDGMATAIVLPLRAATRAGRPLLTHHTRLVGVDSTRAAPGIGTATVAQHSTATVSAARATATTPTVRLDALGALAVSGLRVGTRARRAVLALTVGRPVRVPTTVLVALRAATASVPDRAATAAVDVAGYVRLADATGHVLETTT